MGLEEDLLGSAPLEGLGDEGLEGERVDGWRGGGWEEGVVGDCEGGGRVGRGVCAEGVPGQWGDGLGTGRVVSGLGWAG